MKPNLKAPKHLQPATRRWWQSVVADWQLEAHHVRLLTMAAAAWDTNEAAERAMAAEGLTTKDRFGQVRMHPAVTIARDAKVTFARLLRELDLDVAPPASAKRPPVLRSIG